MATDVWPPGQTTGQHTYAAPGDYTITATQAGGFSETTTVTLTEPPVVLYDAVYGRNGSDGSMTRHDERPVVLPTDQACNFVITTHPPPATAPDSASLQAMTMAELTAAGAMSVYLAGSGGLIPMSALGGMPGDMAVMEDQFDVSVTGPGTAKIGLYSDEGGTVPIHEFIFNWSRA